VRVARDLPEPASVFAAAEMAVCGGGSTAYEMAMLGVPALAVVLSETQKAPGDALAEAGAALCVARADLAKGLEDLAALRDDPDARRRMGERGRALFDGLGRVRILDAAIRVAMGAPEGAGR
jgi:spore coat polysaccharide biosynthesis protein SpsF